MKVLGSRTYAANKMKKKSYHKPETHSVFVPQRIMQNWTVKPGNQNWHAKQQDSDMPFDEEEEDENGEYAKWSYKFNAWSDQ